MSSRVVKTAGGAGSRKTRRDAGDTGTKVGAGERRGVELRVPRGEVLADEDFGWRPALKEGDPLEN